MTHFISQKKRSHTCGELVAKHAGKKVVLMGWCDVRRDHGGLVFVDLRDRWGKTQIVFDPQVCEKTAALAKEIRSEYVLAVEGIVRKRPNGMENKKIATGAIEVIVKEAAILNRSPTPPFEISTDKEVTEEVKLEYRFLDLRREKMQKLLELRHRAAQSVRNYFSQNNFLEIETPMLTRSTPEGARDYLVPSRVNPGRFFALPQSPQLFKQLLMVAGLERYVQVARCFRDEDLRADRQPEFTQLDLEMSFVSEEDVFAVIEPVIAQVFKEELGTTLIVPFPRLSYREAQARYHSDKPDLRTPSSPWAFCWITDFPLFHWNEETKRWDAEHHPFTAPHPDDMELLTQDPGQVRARAYDLVLNGMELGSGSIRIHQDALQRAVFKVLGLSEATVQERFGFLLEAFAYGAPPHGGFALGLDRLIALMTNAQSIREVIAFPKTQKAVDSVTDAPSPVTEAQLKELGITILTAKKSQNVTQH